jgi:hypothetical protein
VEGVSDANHKLLQVSTLSALQVTIDGIGQFLSPYLRDIIQIVISIPDNYATPQVTSFSSMLSYRCWLPPFESILTYLITAGRGEGG